MHASAILVPLLAEATSKSVILIALTCVTGVYILSEALRLNGKRMPIITKFTLRMSRLDERGRFISSPAYLAAGVVLVMLFFPAEIALASIAVVAVGDPVAALVGRSFGRVRFGQKSLEGSAAGLAAGFLLASIFIKPFVALVGTIFAMFYELVGKVDDNLTIPIIAAAVMFLLMTFCQWC